ncbi:MAG TPA: AI-2E family transporter [Acidobacteriaceae bacterium]|jgi:predicted PurR-regulated permease PerM|nr:AI-2E family transporter [Acidobacteriaceae bacterium]
MSKPTGPRATVLFAFGVAIALYLAYLLHDVLVVIYVSALFAVVLMPLVRTIMKLHIGKWHPGRGIAILILLVLAVGGLTLFFIVGLSPAFRDLREFIRELPQKGPEFFARIQKVPVLRDVDLDALQEKVQDMTANIATYAVRFATNWAGTVARILAGMVLTVYFILEGDEAYAWFLSLFPLELRLRLDQTLARASGRMGRWLLGQGTLMLILGVSSTIVFALLHVRYAYALGIIMGLFNLVPVAGALFSMSIVVMVAALDSWGRVAGVLIFYFTYLQIENTWLTPRIMRTQVDLAGLTILIAILIGSSLAGVIGAMVAVPTAVLIAVLIEEYAVHDEPIIAEPHPVEVHGSSSHPPIILP